MKIKTRHRQLVVITIITILISSAYAAPPLPPPVYVAPSESLDTLDLLACSYTYPADNPTPPGDVFSPSLLGSPTSSSPCLADYTRQAGNDDLFVLQGANFGLTSKVWCYTQTSATNGTLYEALLAQSLSQTLTVKTRPSGPYGLTFVWVENQGNVSRPIRLNAAQLWWADQQILTRGASVAVFGRNLSYQNGTTTSSVYVRPWGASSSVASQPCTVTMVNPYRVDFTLPSNLTLNTHYEVWLHNGHGGIYGWTGPLRISIESTTSSWGWPGSIIDVPAGGNIQSAVNSASTGQTIRLAAGTYTLSMPLTVKKGIQLQGAGTASTTIIASATFSGAQMIQMAPGCTRICDLTVDTNGPRAFASSVLKFDGYGIDPIPVGAYVNRVRFIYPGGSQTPCIVLGWCKLAQFTYCQVTAGRSLAVTKVEGCRIWGNSFYGNLTGSDESGTLICAWSVRNFDCNGNAFYSYDRVSGQVARRAVDFQNPYGPSLHCYVGKNQAQGVGPLYGDGVTGQNTGETFLVDCMSSIIAAIPVSVSANSLTFSGQNWTQNDLVTDDLPGWSQQNNASIVQVNTGAGAGQWRKIIANTTNSITIDRPWDVAPSTTDTICINRAQVRTVMYSNTVSFSPDDNGDGVNDNLQIDRASTGIEFWGSVIDSDIVKNRVTGNRHGIVCAGRYYSGSTPAPLQPLSGITVANNDAPGALKNNYIGIWIDPYVAANGSGPFAGGPVIRNIVVRRNAIDSAAYVGILIQKGSPYYNWNWGWAANSVLDNNLFTNTPTPMAEDTYASDTVAR